MASTDTGPAPAWTEPRPRWNKIPKGISVRAAKIAPAEALICAEASSGLDRQTQAVCCGQLWGGQGTEGAGGKVDH